MNCKVLFALLICLPLFTFGQIAVPTFEVAQPSLEKVLQEDARFYENNRIAVPLAVEINPLNDGNWEEVNNNAIWSIEIKSSNALYLSALLKDFELPILSKLEVFRADGGKVGTYTSIHNNTLKTFTLTLMEGSSFRLKYTTLKKFRHQKPFSIWRIYYGYRAMPQNSPITNLQQDRELLIDSTLGFGKSSSCNININCPLGNPVKNQKRAVARLLMVFEQGMTGYCSGSLVNNTKEDGTPYFLTAYHCADVNLTPYWEYWQFDFDYESTNCTNPAQEPTPKVLTGCVPVSGWRGTDFLLLRIATPYLPPSYNLYLNGWSRDTSILASTKTYMIHHPKGDIKKVLADFQPPSVQFGKIIWNNRDTSLPYSHWKMIPDSGFYEIGSSGASILNQNGLIIGQNHGGNTNASNCTVQDLYAGRLSKSWNGNSTEFTRLKDYLDPLGNNPLTLYGLDLPDTLAAYIVGGYIVTPKTEGINAVELILKSDSLTLTATTDTSGFYFFPIVPSQFHYNLSCRKDTIDNNGVSTADMVAIQKHILMQDTFKTPFKIIASDANSDGKVSTADMVEIRKLILQYISEFSKSASWRFIPTIHSFDNPSLPFPFPESVDMFNPQGDFIQVDYWGIKIGDPTYTADRKL